jgi:hypothetical protein
MPGLTRLQGFEEPWKTFREMTQIGIIDELSVTSMIEM